MITYKLLGLHSSNLLIGSFGALYALFPLLLAIPLGRWINQIGEGRFIAMGTTLIVFATLGLMQVQSRLLLAICVAVLGTGQLLAMVGAQALFANRSPRGNYERYFGLYTFAAALGQLIGPFIGSAVSGSRGILPKSTSHAFLAAAILAAVGIIPMFFGTPMKPTVGVSAKNSRKETTFNSLMKNPGMFVAMFTSLAVSSSVDVLVVFLPVFGKEKGFSSGAIGVVIAMRAGTSMISRFFLGPLTQHFGYKKLLVSSIILSSAACIIAVFSTSELFLLIVMAVAGFTLGMGQPMTMSWVSRVALDDERSFAISVRLAGNRLGQFLLPAIAGVVAGGFGAGAVFIALALLMGTSGALTQRREK